MGQLCINGIVSRYADYSESDRILTILTAEHGRIDAKARGCRRPKSPLLPGAQPFIYGEFELYEGREKCTVNKCNVLQAFYPIREDIDRFYIGSAILRLSTEAFQEKEPNAELFLLLYHALSFLAYSDAAPMDLFLCFLVRYLNCIGYCPSITSCGHCGRDIRGDLQVFQSPRHGGAACAACAPGCRPVSKLALECLRRMLLLKDDEMGKARLTDALREEISGFLFSFVMENLEYGARCLSSVGKL